MYEVRLKQIKKQVSEKRNTVGTHKFVDCSVLLDRIRVALCKMRVVNFRNKVFMC
jgi:hypothetical protein